MIDIDDTLYNYKSSYKFSEFDLSSMEEYDVNELSEKNFEWIIMTRNTFSSSTIHKLFYRRTKMFSEKFQEVNILILGEFNPKLVSNKVLNNYIESSICDFDARLCKYFGNRISEKQLRRVINSDTIDYISKREVIPYLKNPILTENEWIKLLKASINNCVYDSDCFIDFLKFYNRPLTQKMFDLIISKNVEIPKNLQTEELVDYLYKNRKEYRYSISKRVLKKMAPEAQLYFEIKN